VKMNMIAKRRYCVVVLLAFLSGAMLGVLLARPSSLGLSVSVLSLLENAHKLFPL